MHLRPEQQPGDCGPLGFIAIDLEGTCTQKWVQQNICITPLSREFPSAANRFRWADKPTIGLLLSESRGKSIVEYALCNVAEPIGVFTYRVTRQLPKPRRDEISFHQDLPDVVEKLRSNLKEEEDEPVTSFPARKQIEPAPDDQVPSSPCARALR